MVTRGTHNFIMIIKKFLRLISAVILTLSLITAFVSSDASAATYVTYSERGIKYLAYSKNILYYSSNSTKVTSSECDQTHSGFFVRNKGCNKNSTLSSTSKHTWTFKNEFLAGAVIGGVTIGFSDIIIDQVIVYPNGKKPTWKYDI
ncbi:hypothetical protein [Caldibacillus debilis]|uniref:hypothetical protein n=3 Tax=Caldibacillus debilis TaxID=301148 RepID=UPI0012906E17|nr:hypothetical protein [Caldibacillus debilis]